MQQRQSQKSFLGADPTLEQRWQALCLNMRSCYERLARAGGGVVVHEQGMMWTRGHMTISSVDAHQVGEQIERALQWYRDQQPLGGAICWYLAETLPQDLGAQLLARGFEPNWQSHWMWCDLRSLQAHSVRPAPFEIRVADDELRWQADEDDEEDYLPYYNREEDLALAVLQRDQPRYVWHLAAFQEQRVVGRCFLTITTGDLGIAGLFSMGVLPAAREQGIGTALAQAACELAQQLGCQHVVLNATSMGESLYRRVGFQSMGYGHTWFLSEVTLTAPTPTKDQVTFLEAIGRGDVMILDEVSRRLEDKFFHEAALNGLTPLDIAVHFHQSASAHWLAEHGVHIDLFSAWDLGWKEQFSAMLVEHPELVLFQHGAWRATLLHLAIQRGDVELAKMLFTVPNDLSIKDAAFEATALGWARHFEQPAIIKLIEQHEAEQKKLE